MATTPPVPPQPGGAAGGSPNPPSPGGAPAPAGATVVQIVAAMNRLALELAKIYPPASPMAEEITNQLRSVQQKISETTAPTQPNAPPI